MRRLLRLSVSIAPLGALVVALAVVDVGMFAVAPGPARDVLPLIELDAPETHRSRGRLLLTTVRVGRVEALPAVWGMLDPAVEVVPERQIVPRGVTEEEYEEVTRSLMDESKVAAVAVVLEMLTAYPDDHGPGALVQDVIPDGPADGLLQAGDLIVAVEDRRVRDPDHLRTLIDGSEGRSLALTVESEGEERTVRVRPRRLEGEEQPLIGVIVVAGFPFEVAIDSGAIGGPSAGLMWALGVYELLTREDVLRGREVAGTGTIRLGGEVGPVGGIEQKVRAAEGAGADVFVLPADNLEAARPVAREIRLIPVRSLEEAVRALSSDDAPPG